MKIKLRSFEKYFIFYILSCFLVASCSEQKTAQEQNVETFKPAISEQEARIEAVIDSYWDALREIEGVTGKESSHSYYSRFTFREQDEERILHCAQWVLANTWTDGSTTSSVLLKAIEVNRESLDLLSRGVEIDNPVLPPMAGFETPIPNWRKLYIIALLHLVETKRKVAEKLSQPEYETLDPEAHAGLEVLRFGGHFMCDNGTLIHYLIGNAIRCAAADFLTRIIEKDTSLTLDRLDIINRILEHEEKRNSLLVGWRDDLILGRDSYVKVYGHVFPPDPPIELLNHLRNKLSKEMNVSTATLTQDMIKDLYSTNTLTRYFNEFIHLGEGFAQLSPLEREQETETYLMQAAELSPRRSPYLTNVAIPDLVIPLSLEQIVTAKLRLIVSSLAVQEGVKMKRTTQPQQSVKILNLDPSWAIDPFTDRPFTALYTKPGRLTLNSLAPQWFFEMDQLYAQNRKLDIDFPTPRERVRE